MPYYSRRPKRNNDAMTIKINGRLVDLFVARIVYKCAECLGDLELNGPGLRCKDNHEHRRFLHRDEVAEILERQNKNIESLKEVYKIINGKVVIKDGN